MQVKLTKELEVFIAEKVETGGYADPSEVVREALRALKAQDDPAEVDSQELAQLLLPAVRGEQYLDGPARSHPIAALELPGSFHPSFALNEARLCKSSA